LALSGIAIGLGCAELVWAFVVFLIITSEVNALWEARGRVGYESVTDWSLSVPFLLTLLIVPAIITVLAAANFRRHWWVGVLLGVLLGGWPAIVIALLALISPGSGRLETIVTIGAIVAALIAIGWLVHRSVWGSWKLSADGQSWARGRRSFPTVSIDGRWRWDGRTWQPEPLAAAEKVEG
jgi:hypothetical protein